MKILPAAVARVVAATPPSPDVDAAPSPRFVPVASVGKVSAELGADIPVLIDNTALQIVPDYRIQGGNRSSSVDWERKRGEGAASTSGDAASPPLHKREQLLPACYQRAHCFRLSLHLLQLSSAR